LASRTETLRDEIDTFQALCEHPGWKLLVKMAQGQMDNRMRIVMTSPLTEGHTIEAQEFLKGEYAGLNTFVGLPEALIKSAKLKLADLKGNGNGD